MGFGSGGGNNFGSGKSDLDSDLTIDGSVKIKEGSAADADIAGQGQLWVKSDAPNNLYFTDDTGQDVQITANGSLAGVAGSLSGLGSTDKVILRSNGTGGETAQGSGILIDDSNNFTIPTTAKIQFRDSGLFINSSTNGQLDIDADVEVEITAPTVQFLASSTVLVGAPALRVFSGNSASPIVSIECTNPDATGGTLRFLKDGASTADNDIVGNITFLSEDDGDNVHIYASIIGSITDMTGGAEGGRLELKVAEHDGTVTTGFKLQDGDADGEIDVTIAAAATSVTTIVGTSQFNAAATFGADDTGVDVRMFSATASEGVLYDASEDELGLLLTTKLSFHDIGGGENIFASDNGHLEVNAGTTLDMTAPTVDINASTTATVDTAIFSIDGTDDSNITVTASGKDLDLAVAGGGTQELRLASAGTGTAAIHLNASAGGIDIDSADMIDIDAADEITIDTTSADGHIAVTSAHTAGQAILISANADAGSILDIDAGIIDIDVQAGVTLDATTLTVTTDTATFASANSADPLVIIKNTTNDANGARLQLVKDRGAAGAANDENGLIQFIGDDANQDQVTFSEIKSQVKVHTNGQEGGKLTLSVAEHDGTLTQGLLIADGDADGELDVTIGAGASSVTQIAGTLDLGDRNITNVGDIDLDKISVADAASGLLIDASGANTGTAAVILGDNLAQAFAVVETSGGSVTYMGFATTNGSELVTIAKPLEIANGSANGATALLIDNDDTNQIALHIEAANIDADVIQIDADAVTTAHVIDITADALTTGAVLNVGALGKNPIILDHNYTDSSAATVTCLDIDFDKSGGESTANTITGIKLDMDCSDMTGGTNTMKGLVVTPTLINASGAGAATVFGLDVTATGGEQGNATVARGLNVVATDADYNQGIHITSDSTGTGWNHLKLISSEDSGDYCTIKVGTNGETTIETTDGGAALAHLNLVVDGELVMKTAPETLAGAGGVASGGYVTTTHKKVNGLFTTTIQLDITGLTSTDADNKIIGETGAGNAYLTKLETAKTGRIYRAEMICIEAPNAGEPDFDLISSTSGTLVASNAEGTNNLIVDADGDWVIGKFKDNFTVGTIDLNNNYLYLSTGTAASTVAGTYDAGKYLIVLYGA